MERFGVLLLSNTRLVKPLHEHTHRKRGTTVADVWGLAKQRAMLLDIIGANPVAIRTGRTFPDAVRLVLTQAATLAVIPMDAAILDSMGSPMVCHNKMLANLPTDRRSILPDILGNLIEGFASIQTVVNCIPVFDGHML